MTVPKPPSEEFLFRALMESTADSIYFKDRHCRLLRVSRKMAKDLGYSDPAELTGKTDVDLFGEQFGRRTRLDDTSIMETGRPIIGVVESRRVEGGRTNWTLTTKLPLYGDDGEIIGLVGITREINEMRETEVALQHLATHDTLTDLPNRFLMVDRLSQLLSRASRSGNAFSVLFMDVDGFKEINDTHGHEVGDQVLCAVADRLTKNVRHSDTVARIGGDEFVVIMETVHSIPDAEMVAEKLRAAVARPLVLQQHKLSVTVSIGISFFPDNGTDADTLLRAADYAMYLAKRDGGNRHLTCLPGVTLSTEANAR
jgi:diguanylate cyclase (GGDEF)-like protein/PAS domain S-box-containing protein